MEIFPQKIEIDLTGTGKVTVFHDIEVTVGGKKVQVMEEEKGPDGKLRKIQPSTTFEACDCLAAVIEEIAKSVREGVPFEFPDVHTIPELAKAQADRKPKPVEKPVKVEAVAAEEAAPAAEALYPDEPAGVEGGK